MSCEINAVYNSVEVVDGCLELTNKIKGALYQVAHNFVYIGFLLAECNDYQTYKEWGYNSIYEYALDQFNFKKSSVNNFINVCKTFSSNWSNNGHNLPYSMVMKDGYADFNYSQLVEMLSMSDKQRASVTSDMSVRQIRELKKVECVVDVESVVEEPTVSRRLEDAYVPDETSAPVLSDVDYSVPDPVALRMLFDDIESASLLNEAYDGMDLYDIVLDFFKQEGYIIYKKLKITKDP